MKNHHIHSLTTLLLMMAAAASITSCEKYSNTGRNKIKVDMVKTSTKADPGDYISMSGETITSKLESGFVLDAYIDDICYDYSTNPKTEYPKGIYVNSDGNINVTKEAGKWKIAGEPTWASDVNTQFWAHYPHPVKGSLSFTEVAEPYTSLVFNYTMPTADGSTDASANFDDPVFSHVGQKFTGTNDSFDLTFHHALAQIRFCVSLDGSDPDKCDTGITITKIEICGIKNKGVCTFNSDNTFTWTGQDGDYIFGQSVGAFSSGDWQDHTVGSYNGKICKYGFYVIPQSASGVSLKVTITNGVKTVTSQKDLTSFDWAADNYYTYKLSIKGDALANITLVSANALHQAFDQSINLEY